MPKEISKELIRQIDIISMVLDKPDNFSENDISRLVSESLTTVRRDFTKIREIGIPLHSSKRRLKINQKISTKLLNKLINTYLALNDTDTIKNLKGIRQIFKDETLKYFVQIVKSINQKTKIEFDYEKDEKRITLRRNVIPVGLLKTSRSFILVGLENDDIQKVRFYLIEKLQNINFTSKKSAHKSLPSMYEFLKDSWGIYQSGVVENVELLFDNSCTNIKNRVFINNQIILETEKGVLFKAKLKISREFISWILGWGNKCKVIKPKSLRNEIIKTAKDIIKKY
ncbi:MAG: WYL domain-containing transcriptional regulator [Ignavibacteria bacterium]